MNTVDIISGLLLGGAVAAAACGLWRATASTAPPGGRVRRLPELFGAALILAGAGLYIRAMNDGPPPGPVHRTSWSPVVAASAAVMLAAAAGCTAWTIRTRRRPQRPPVQTVLDDGDLAALNARHDAVRERFGALLTADGASRLEAAPALLAALTQTLTTAADSQTGPHGSYAARSAYARAVGELEAAWEPVEDQARRQGIDLPDDLS